MYLKFSVPDFPAFRNNLDTVDYRRYDEHVNRFQNYAAFVVKAQIDIAEKALAKGYMKDELAMLKDSIRGMNEAANYCVEKSSMIVESELTQVKEQIALEVAKINRQYDEGASFPEPADPVVVVKVADDFKTVRGPNWERNVRAREARKLRKIARQNSGFDWRKGAAAGVPGGRLNHGSRVVGSDEQTNNLKAEGNKLASEVESGTDSGSRGQIGRNGKPVKDSIGFWKSCSDEVRQQLIDSKARMHVAENERKTREAENRVAYLNSPQAIVDEVTRMINRAEALAQKQGNDKILGWAKSVTNSSAESLARSAPSTVPSYESVSTSVDEAAKLAEIQRQAAASDNLKKLHARIAQLEREKEVLEKQVSQQRPVECAPVRRKDESEQSFRARCETYARLRATY